MSLLARAVFVLLVVATFAAFFVAQRLKSAPQVAVIKKVTRHFSPNGDGRRDVSRIRVRVRKDDDVTISIVDANGTEVKRLAHGASPPCARRRSACAGTARRPTGSARAGGRLPRARRACAAAAAPSRSSRASTLDVTAPRPTVLAGGPEDRWITGPVGGPVPFRVRVVSQRYPTRIQVLRTDVGEPREVAALPPAPGEREGEWDGRADGAPAPPGTYQIVALGARPGRQRRPLGAGGAAASCAASRA